MSPKKEFVHLHLHTQFSLLDGAIKIKELPEYALKLGYKAVAITDHGNLFGSHRFYKALKGVGLKPIIGMEAYITKGSRFTKIGKGTEDNYTDTQNHHIVLIAKNDIGLKNLMKLSSKGYLEGLHYKPRIDLELLNEHREGLICLTACLKGLPTYYASRGEEREAEKWLLKLVDIFGKEDLYVELQPHDIEEQITANRILVELAKKHGLKTIATCDVHYLKPEDKAAHNILVALQTKKKYQELLQSPYGQKLQKMELHFASPEEVWRRFENKFDGWEKALLNTLEVAEKVADSLEYFENTDYKMPVYQVPEGETLESYFRKLAVEGLKKRIAKGQAKDDPIYWERLNYEMDVISKMGFPGYFLIVQDFINWAKERGIPVGPGRGCVLPETPVMLGSGEIKPIKEVDVGDFVLTHRGAVLPVLNRFEYDVEETLVEVDVGNERLTLTEDHKVLALKTVPCKVKSVKPTICKPTCNRYCKEKPYKNYILQWLPASQLRKGDFLVFPRQPSMEREIVFDLLRYVEKSKAPRWDENYLWYERGSNALKTSKVPRFVKFDHDLAKILGYFLSEGYTKVDPNGGVVGFGFHKKERKFAEELLKLFEKVFNLKGKIFESKNRNAIRVEFKSKIVAQFLRNLCGDRATNKRIPPEIVLKGKDEFVKTLIGYMFRGDGHNGKAERTTSINYTTTSPSLAYQLRLLLARFGFWASVLKQNRKRENWNIQYKLKLSGKQLLRWNEVFKDFPVEVKGQKFFRNDSFFVDERFIYVKVRNVKKVPYKGKVYDITVPVDHSYTTSAVSIHNSAGGSLVAYALGITDIDPIKHDLLFERFLNPDRVSMPDIDVDFCQDRRDEVIDYVRQKYGKDNVSQIITYNFLKSKSVIRDVCRAFGVPLEKADRLAKLIPQGETQGSQLSLEEMTDWTMEQLKEKYGERPDIEDSVLKFRQMVNSDPSLKRIVEVAKKLDGLARHTGIHAAGVVIAPEPLIELTPLFARKEKDKETKKEKFTVATQYDMAVLEEVGLLKMDFLGLKTLTELDHMKKMVKELYGRDINFLELDYTDPKVYELLKSGKTTGVFQLESKGMQNLLIRLKPDRFDDLIAVLALYRPGPLKSGLVDSFVRRKHGEEPITYEFPELEPILKETYGLCLSGDSEIYLSDGRSLTIKEIVEGNLTGLEVLSVDLKTNKTVKGRIKRVFDNGVKDVYELVLSNGMRIKATEDHKFLTPEGWKELKDLKVGKDLLAVPKKVPTAGNTYNPYRLKVLAYLLADGYISGKTGVAFVNKDPVLVKSFKEATLKGFENVKFTDYLRRNNVINSFVVSKVRDRYRSNRVLLWLEELGLRFKRSEEKFIPQFVFDLREDLIALFLAAFWDCDGYTGRDTAHIKTLSQKIAYGVQKLLLKLGIQSAVYVTKQDGKNVYQVNVLDLKRFAEKVIPFMVTDKAKRAIPKREARGFYPKEVAVEKALRFMEENGISQRGFSKKTGVSRSGFFRSKNPWVDTNLLKKVNFLLGDEEIETYLNGDILFIPVKEIRYVGKERVYDLEIETYHNFVANGIVCHNCIYQEQIMKMSQILSGFTPGEADTLRKAIGKKKKDLMEQMKGKFIEGAVKKGHDRKKIEELWDSIEKFASYSFNKSHSTAYAYISFWTAYFKAHYPGVFFAVKLSTEKNENKFIALIKDAKLFGFELLPPDINKSDIHFSLEEKDGKTYIRYGLAKIKGVGEEAAKAIKEAKERFGRFKSLADFVKKVDKRKVNKKVIEALIEAGAFDFTGESREELLKKVRSDEKLTLAVGQNNLFANKGKKGSLKVEEKLELLKRERELLGFYLSGHPLDPFPHLLEKFKTRIEDLEEDTPETVEIPGVVVDFQEKRTRSGKYMAIFNLIDKTGIIECVVFPETYEAVKDKLGEDKVVVVSGYISTDFETERKKLVVQSVKTPEEIGEEISIRINLYEREINDQFLQRLKEFLKQFSDPYEGKPTYIRLHTGEGIFDIELGREFWVVPNANNLNILRTKLKKRLEIID